MKRLKYTGNRLCLIMLLAGASVWAASQQTSVATVYPVRGSEPGATHSAPSGAVSVALAAIPDQPADSPVVTIRTQVDEVNVVFIATDKHGKFVRNLNQRDFTILDDHQPPQSILDFRPETDLPVEMGLLIDVSGSVHTRFGFEQEAATAFLQHVVRRGSDRAFVMGFSSRSQLVQDFTDNAGLLAQSVGRLHEGGGTALYDAVYHACRDKLLSKKESRPVRKALVILSDGEDNQSEVTRAETVEMALRADVILYAISTDDSGLILRGDRNLEQLAAATGGRAFFPYKMKDVSRSFSEIEEELRSQYAVSYKPAGFEADGRYRSIEITVPRKDLQVRARKGYFAARQ